MSCARFPSRFPSPASMHSSQLNRFPFFPSFNSEWVEALGWYKQEDKDQVTGNDHE